MPSIRILFAFSIAVLCSISALADNWPRFRGENGGGIASEADLPAKWSNDELAWKISLPASGNSSPVVWNDTVYVTSGDGDAGVYSVSAMDVSNGETRWQKDYTFKPRRVHQLNGYATSTPAVDESGVYVLWFGEGESLVAGISHDGEELWKHDFGKLSSMHGPSASPMVHDGKLIFTWENEGARPGLKSYWYALDCKTGETVWKTDRDTSAKASSSVPCVYESPNGDWLIFSSFSHGITAVDAQTGEVVWEENESMIARTISSPMLAGDIVFATCGRRGGGMRMVAIDLNQGEGATPRVLHSIEEKFVPYVPTPIAVNDLLFTFHDDGTVSCMAVKTGELIWSERLRTKFFGSPVLVRDRLYCIGDGGEVFVLRAGPEFEELAVNSLGEESHATPAVANRRMFLRTNTQLMCIAAPDAN